MQEKRAIFIDCDRHKWLDFILTSVVTLVLVWNCTIG